MISFALQVVALGLAAFLPHALAEGNKLQFNMTVPANSTLLYYGKNFNPSPDGSTITYNPQPEQLFYYRFEGQVWFWYPGGTFCLNGEFEEQVVMDVNRDYEVASKNQTITTNGKTVCGNPAAWGPQVVGIYSGLKSVSNLTFVTDTEAPFGATTQQIASYNSRMVENGQLSSNSTFSFDSVSAVDGQVKLTENSTVQISVPIGTAYFVIRGSGAVGKTASTPNISMNHPWPTTIGSQDVNRSPRPGSTALSIWNLQYAVGADGTLFTCPLDSTLEYTLTITGAGTNSYKLASIDLYSIDMTLPHVVAKKARVPVGAIAGGVIGGVVVLGLAIGLLFYLIRRKRRADKSTAEEKFVVEPDITVRPFQPAATPLMVQEPASLLSPTHMSHSDGTRSESSWNHSTLSSISGAGLMTGAGSVPGGIAKAREAVRGVEGSPNEILVLRHDSDAGAVVSQPVVREELLPPVYDATWDGNNSAAHSSSAPSEPAPSSRGSVSYHGSMLPEKSPSGNGH